MRRCLLLIFLFSISSLAMAGIPVVEIPVSLPNPIPKDSQTHAKFYNGESWPEGYIALTFDDGPNPKNTRAVLDVLKKYGIRATFFMVGEMAEAHPAMAKEVLSEGHVIGTHTFKHLNLTKMTIDKALAEIHRGINAVEKALGVSIPPFFRFPFLDSSPLLRDAVANEGFVAFGWDRIELSSRFSLAPEKGHLKKGVLISHDLQSSAAQALPRFLEEMDKYGYTAVVPVVVPGI